MKATSYSSSISANLGNSAKAWCHTFVIHKYSVGLRKKVMAATLSYFCELVEGEENKLTTFSTWTTMLGCNESNIIFQQHLCKLGQLRKSMVEIHKYSVGLRKKVMAATLSYFL